MSGLGAAAARHLSANGTAPMEPGLSDDEVVHLESSFGFTFADDHREFLATGLPVGEGWPNWRADGHRRLERRLRLPVDGILFAVEWKRFWDDGWGARPARMKDALRSAAYHLARAPRMIPVHSHCYLPSGREFTGHPVLSIYQADIRVIAPDLLDYVTLLPPPDSTSTGSPTVAFWSAHVH
ncbi:hypothetical protein ACN27E_09850 [Mycobacterium sp. WMMD1722]|uniref:hypothetical protein n=1 Tax=Mycobacterium sp. WMMD1722 TaxID=3404117 RepID=UPI003BF48CA5